MRKLSLYFAKGLLVLLPLLGTVYILAFIYSKIAGVGNAILYPIVKRELPWGVDFIFVIMAVCLIGMVANWWISKKILQIIEDIICRMPGIKNIYNTIKDTLKSLTGEEKKFDTVVLVNLTDDICRLGFLTVKASSLRDKEGRELVGVYFPQTMQVSGDMYWVPRELVTVVDMPVDQALRLIISGGATGAGEVTAQGQGQWQVVYKRGEKVKG
ncbi:DUF502 domain-containing protein [Desulforamulus ferrireducens]|uniref:DUF502 domain-containing protein n=1 Tax=Desulforamulus ferrireducens TaxID=1833852 RepID=A0A1S6IZ97_9FIRM|nr:DUF502 domain-containing protein [Desulforamulus ferrireducens]AQS60094.1 hypothetical protein B0537_14035 [Desulforamulus ferrireducens]